MSYITVDYIAHSWLLDRRYTNHWYVDAVNECSNFLKEAILHSLNIVTPAKIPLNSYKAGPLPCGFIDWVVVGVQRGQYRTPLAQREGFVRTNSFNDAGEKVPHGILLQNDLYGYSDVYFWVTNTNRFGESLGQRYGGTGQDNGAFKILLERNEIQMDEAFEGDEIYMECITSVNNITAASKIPEECFTAAKAYIDWKYAKNKRSSAPGEVAGLKDYYDKQLRVLRANRFDYSLEDIADIFYASINAGPK